MDVGRGVEGTVKGENLHGCQRGEKGEVKETRQTGIMQTRERMNEREDVKGREGGGRRRSRHHKGDGNV